MRLALIQQPAGPDREENLARALEAMRRAADSGAQMAIFAEVLGGAKPIPPELLQATVGRRDEFARAGVRRA